MARAKFGSSLGDNYSDKQYGKSSVIPRKDNPSTYLQAAGSLGKNGNGHSAKMGDANPNSVPDMQDVIEVMDWASDTYDDIAKVKAIYAMAQIYLTTREKLAYLAYLGSSISRDLQLYSVVASAPGGLDFLKSSLAAANSLQAFDRPKALQSFLNCTTAFETIVFPRMGIEVRGFVGQFNGTDYAASRIGNTGPSSKDVYDFGDLSATPIVADMDALQLMTKDVKARYQLGIGFLIALGAVVVFLLAVSIIVTAFLRQFKSTTPSDILDDSNVKGYLESLPPAQRQKETHDILFGGSLLNQNRGSDVFTMLAALGAVIAGGGFLYWLWKS